MSKHLEEHNLHAEYQSGYRLHRSCEVATLAMSVTLEAIYHFTSRRSKLTRLSRNPSLKGKKVSGITAGIVLKSSNAYLEA